MTLRKWLLFSLLLVSLVAQAGRRENRIAKEIRKQTEWVVTPEPLDQEVCFSPEEPCEIKLTKFIRSAKKSLDIAVFDINLEEVVEEVIKKSKSIKVRMIVDKRQAKGDHSRVGDLVRAGAELRYGSQRGLMHNKFVLVDGERVETGSFNFTGHAARANSENQIYLSNPKVVARYQKRFEEIWQRARRIQLKVP